MLDDFWHSEIASDPDNQNKDKVRVFRGVNASNEQEYERHSRRAQKMSDKKALAVFRSSEFCTRLNAGRPASKRVVVGRRQLAEAKCKCIQKRKASDCDCEPCTYVQDNMEHVNRQRQGWHAAAKRQRGGKPCDCRIHGAAAAAALRAETARDAAETAWHAAGATDSEESAAAAAATYEQHAAAEAAALAQGAAAAAKAQLYDDMLKSPEHLMAALLPCGRTVYPDYSVTGAKPFAEYDRQCVHDNCPKKLFAARAACGWGAQFGGGCPTDLEEGRCDWQVWSQQLRTPVKEDGAPYYSLEFIPKSGTRAEFFSEFRDEARRPPAATPPLSPCRSPAPQPQAEFWSGVLEDPPRTTLCLPPLPQWYALHPSTPPPLHPSAPLHPHRCESGYHTRGAIA